MPAVVSRDVDNNRERAPELLTVYSDLGYI